MKGEKRPSGNPKRGDTPDIDLKKLADDIDRFKPAREIPRKRKGVTVTMSALEAHIRANWKIREIIFFRDFTHGGTYDAGKGWRMSFAGYAADTAEEQRNLIDLFRGLCYEAFFFMGMKQRAEMDAGVPPVVGWTRFDPGGAKSPLAKTLNALIRSIPSKKAKGRRAA